MDYLKPLVQRLTDNEQAIARYQTLENDEKVYSELMKVLTFEEVADVFQDYYGVGFVNPIKYDVERSILAIFDVDILKAHHVLPYRLDEATQTYYFAINDFLNEDLRDTITRSCEKHQAKARFLFALKEHISQMYDTILEDNMEVDVVVDEEAHETHDPREEFSAQQWVENILNKSIQYGASDIHIEKLEDSLKVRYRVDGVMTRSKYYHYPDSIVSSIFVRIKVISGLDISEKRKPQDGRIDNYEHSGQRFDLRVSTVTTIHGEKCVMRLLDKSSQILSFEQLGFSDKDAHTVETMMRNKNGIIYIAGATGSGKTTTLYTMIDGVNEDTINMYTIENPVEKTIDNVNQIQIDPLAGITYASTLRALLRQDPDIIIVGEIRDTETAELSVQASLTGHLVVSTIHANSAIDSISRLLNMGVEPYLIVGSSLGFLSQRLVRKLCDHCKVPHTELSPHEEAWVTKQEEKYDVRIDRTDFYQAVGCERCTMGYKGRVAIVEIIEMSPSIKDLILNNASLSEIEQQALKESFTPLALNGLSKAELGLTQIEELIKELT